MTRQIYRCKKHGEFEVNYNISETVRPLCYCLCGRDSDWVPQVVSFSVHGGTGAQKKPRE